MPFSIVTFPSAYSCLFVSERDCCLVPIEIEPANVLPTQSDIDAFEQSAGIQLPPEYCAFLLQYGDGRPVDSQYPGDRRGISVERFFTVLPGRNSIARHMEMLDGRIMKTSIPIADCPAATRY